MSDQYTAPTPGQSFPLTGKKQEIVTKYLADMLGVESHIYQALDKQVKETQDEPDVNPILRNIRDTLERHTNELRARLEALGGKPTSPIKEAGASILGVAAGLVDKARAEEIAKDFRDNYTALSLSHISYLMLISTCLACDDTQTADLATRHLKDNARFISDIGNLMPTLVVRDLSDLTDLNPRAIEEGRKRYTSAWSR
jgi:ferritin-like metal-binding protein YciE